MQVHTYYPSPTLLHWRLIVLIIVVYTTVTSFFVSNNFGNSGSDYPSAGELSESSLTSAADSPVNKRRRAAVISLAKAAWNATTAMTTKMSNGSDRSRSIVPAAHDALDSLILFGLHKEATQAFAWIAASSRGASSHIIRSGTVIADAAQRIVGGLFGAYSLTGNQAFLDRAMLHLATLRASAYPLGTERGHDDDDDQQIIPNRYVGSPPKSRRRDAESSGCSSSSSSLVDDDYTSSDDDLRDGRCPVSEIFSLAVPFTWASLYHMEDGSAQRSSKSLGTRFQRWLMEQSVLAAAPEETNKRRVPLRLDKRLYDKKFDVRGAPAHSRPGLVPCFVGCNSNIKSQPRFSGSVSVGSRHGRFQLDSYLKQWILSGKRDAVLAALYEDAVDAVLTQLVRYVPSSTGSFRATLGQSSVDFDASLLETDEACRVPGVLALGLLHNVHSNNNNNNNTSGGNTRRWAARDIEALASDLLTTCVGLLLEHPLHVVPKTKLMVSQSWKRATAVAPPSSSSKGQDSSAPSMTAGGLAESLFYMYRYTQDEGLRDIAAEVLAGFIAVTSNGSEKDKRASLLHPDLLPQTLKFLFLTFSDAHFVPLDRFVLDHGGHPLLLP